MSGSDSGVIPQIMAHLLRADPVYTQGKLRQLNNARLQTETLLYVCFVPLRFSTGLNSCYYLHLHMFVCPLNRISDQCSGYNGKIQGEGHTSFRLQLWAHTGILGVWSAGKGHSIVKL